MYPYRTTAAFTAPCVARIVPLRTHRIAPQATARAGCTRRQLLYVLAAPAVGMATFTPTKALFARGRGLPSGEAVKALPAEYPDQLPFTDADFKRYDEAPDTRFYAYPRLVSHIDDNCIAALRAYLADAFKPGEHILDLCASYVSYHPSGVTAMGLGMNADEMRANSALADFRVKDLNISDGIFPFENTVYDRVLCVVSIDYLTRPIDALKECARVLKDGGSVHLAFSDRMFADKAISLWTRTGDADHIWILANFLHFSGAFERATVKDLSPRGPRGGLLGDPLYIVEAIKKS